MSTEMDVAIVYDKFGKGDAGGARISLNTLLAGLPEEWQFTVYDADREESTVSDVTDIYRSFPIRQVSRLVWFNQIAVRHQWRQHLDEALADHDVLITQGKPGPAAVAVASASGIPTIFFVRSIQATGVEKYDPNTGAISNFRQTDFGGKVQFPLLRKNVSDYRRAMETADVVVANSEYTSEQLQNLFNVDSEVIYPPIKLSDYRTTPDRDGYITMINPRSVDKGVDIFFDIAIERPEDDFLLVGEVAPKEQRNRAKQLDNVFLAGWKSDVREAYKTSKLVVVPSRYSEPFGRVAAEAMVSGIPCVVSDRGGLPEVVGQSGEIVSNIESTSAWITAIDRAISQHDPGSQMNRVERFSAEQQVIRLQSILEQVTT